VLEPSSGNKSRDVLEKDPSRLNIANDADNERPDPPLVLGALPLSGGAPRLAREARSDAIHDSTPRAAVEGSKVVPDRSRSQGAFFHARDQDRGGIGFPLHVTDGTSGRLGESDSEFQSSDAGT
jgi:hypothetical protein